MRTYLFLQGPHGSFFRELGLALQRAGHRVLRVNICGGDVVDWHSREAVWYQGRTTDWSGWIGDLMRREGVTDLLAFGDWRPLHREAILVARLRNIRVWAFEEGYLRPHYITMEEGGVNGNSMLPHSPALLRELAESHPAPPSPVAVQNPLSARVWKAIAYYAGTIFLRPFFPWFPDASPAERRERSLGMVPSRPDPPHMGKAFGGERPGNLSVACSLFPVSSPA